MATKKQNKRGNVRKMRRVLKRSWEAIKRLRSKIHENSYGGGLGRGDLGKNRPLGEVIDDEQGS